MHQKEEVVNHLLNNMDCFSKLVKTRFLRNIVSEVKLARTTLISDTMQHGKPSFFPCRYVDRKKLYNHYMKLYGFKSSFDDIDVNDDDDLVYYLQSDYIVWIASRYKYVVDKAILETAYTTGELCIHKCKHIIQSKAVYAAMFDIRLCITPITTN